MIRRDAGQCRGRLDGIDTAHACSAHRIAPTGEVTCEADMSWCRAQQIAVDCQDHVRSGQSGNHFYRLAVGEHRASAYRITRYGLPLMPLRLWIHPEQCFHQSPQRRRRGCPGQYAEAFAVRALQLVALLRKSGLQRLPILGDIITGDPRGAIRVIEAEDFSLGDRIGAAKAGRMVGLPSTLMGRPTLCRTRTPAA